MLFHVYDDPKPDGYFLYEPEGIYRTVLGADWVLYLLLPMLLIIIVVGLMYAWHLHEIPKHKADHKKMRQAELVGVLTILGLFEHWVWAVALFIAYMDWEAVEDWVLSIVRRSRDDSINSPTVIVESDAPVDVVVLSDSAVSGETPVLAQNSEEPRP